LLNRSGSYWGDVAGLTVAFACRLMLNRRQHFGIRPPEARVQHALLVGLRDAPPQQTARFLAAPANRTFQVCQCSRPRSVAFYANAVGHTGPARPSACSCDDGRMTRVRPVPARLFLRRRQAAREPASLPAAATSRLFLSHVIKVWRLMCPTALAKMRHTPRKEQRSW